MSSKDVLADLAAQIPLVERSYVRCFTQSAASLSMLLAGFWAAQTIAGPAVLGILAFAVLGMLLGAALRQVVSRRSSQALADRGDFVQLVHAGANAATELRHAPADDYWSRLLRMSHVVENSSARAGRAAAAAAAASTTLVRAGALCATSIGIYLVAHGQATTLDLATLLMLGGLVSGPFGAFSSIGQELSRCRRALRDIRRDAVSEDVPRFTGRAVLSDDLRLEGLFVRVGDAELLSDIDLVVRPGDKVALVGASGSGKTTLLRVLAGQVGGGVGIDPASDLRYRFETAVYVDQDCHLLPRDVRADEVDGLRLVRLSDDVMERAWNDGQLSGGQRRRVAVVRAFSLGRSVILLDEPTAGLDRSATKAVARLISGTDATVVVATHERDIAAACGRVLHVEDRRIVEVGSHEQLVHESDRYRRLWDGVGAGPDERKLPGCGAGPVPARSR